MGRNLREEIVITHLGTVQTLYRIGWHPIGLCTHCSQPEMAKHVLLECNSQNGQRRDLQVALQEAKLDITLGNLIGRA